MDAKAKRKAAMETDEKDLKKKGLEFGISPLSGKSSGELDWTGRTGLD
jgi:hypothetical protein